MPFEFIKQKIPEVILVIPPVFPDNRGVYLETYKNSCFKENGIPEEFLQDNQSISRKGVLRGLHFQMNTSAQGKLVRVVNGEAFDVAVDLRKSSPYYMQYVSAILNGENNHILWIPEGFAHGFYSLRDNTVLLYKTTKEYDKSTESGVIWNDPQLNIAWPEGDKIISEKDSSLKTLEECVNNFYQKPFRI